MTSATSTAKSNAQSSATKNHHGGFTLIELLLVLAILGVLMAMTVPNLMGRQQSANIDITQGSIAGIDQAIQMYQLDHQGLTPNMQEGLQALVEKVNSRDKRWRGPYLKNLPVDAWGNEFRYLMPGKKNTTTYDIISSGPDRQFGTSDDIGNWTN